MLLPVLVACDPLPFSKDAALAVGVEEGMVLVHSCEDLKVRDVWFMWRDPESREEVFAWEAYGNLDIEAGDTLTSEAPPDALADVVVWESFDLAATDKVWFYGSQGSGRGIGVDFNVPDAGVPEGSWLLPGGIISDEPCPSS